VTAASGPRDERPSPVGNRRIFWVCVLVGWVLIAIGIRGVIVDARTTRPPQWGAWFVGAALFHDLLVAPVVFVVAARLLRRVRRPFRALVQAALILTAFVAAGSLPVVLRLGEPTGNPTVLPEDALPAFLGVLGAIWGATVVLLLAAARRNRGTPRAAPR
jgi:hypothetical protein